jgi:hypothetical protein
VEEQDGATGAWRTLRELKNPSTVGLLTREQWELAQGLTIRFGITADEIKALPVMK